ncbi:hypothetical protein GCM10029964_036960 [Kibdelosporangium lantanae]
MVRCFVTRSYEDMLRWSWVAATTDVPLIASPLLPAFAMKVVKAPVDGLYRRMSEGWTFCGPVPSRMSLNSRVCDAASQVGPSRKLNPSLILVAVSVGAGSGLPNGPEGHGPAAAASVTVRPAAASAATVRTRPNMTLLAGWGAIFHGSVCPRTAQLP